MKVMIMFNRQPYDNTDVTWSGLRYLEWRWVDAAFMLSGPFQVAAAGPAFTFSIRSQLVSRIRVPASGLKRV